MGSPSACSCVLLTHPSHSLSISLLSGIRRLPGLFYSWFLLVKNGREKPMLDGPYAHSYWDVIISGPSQLIGLEFVYMPLCISLYIYLYISSISMYAGLYFYVYIF